MATKFYPQISQTHPSAGAFQTYRDMLTARGASVSNLGFRTTPNALGENPMYQSGTNEGSRLYSERLSADVTIAGSVTFNIWATRNVTTFTGRLRARLYKITAGGSDVETLIVTADASADISGATGTSVLYSFSATPATAVTVAANERLIWAVSVVLSSGSLALTSNVQFDFGSASASVKGDTWVQITETVTTLPNALQLFLRRTTAAGVSTHFDMLDTRGGSAATTGVVNTVTGPGAQVQWTRTAGGTLLSWVSPRISYGWTIGSANFIGAARVYAQESATAANAGALLQLFKRYASGTEVLLLAWPGPVSELTTSAAAYVMVAPTTLIASGADLIFAEDDRLVVKAFITDAGGTMASGRTATITYDHNVADATGDCYISLNDPPAFKAESDPVASARVPSGLATGGVGN